MAQHSSISDCEDEGTTATLPVRDRFEIHLSANWAPASGVLRMDQHEHEASSIFLQCMQGVEELGRQYQIPQPLVQIVLDSLSRMFAFAVARLGNQEEAMSVIVVAVENVFAFIARGNPVKLLDRFLWVTLRNEISRVLREWRTRIRTTTCSDGVLDSVVAVGPGPEEIAMKKERQERLESAINKLSFDHRAAILARLGGLSGGDAAASLGIPHGTYRTRLFTALLKLRQILGPDFE